MHPATALGWRAKSGARGSAGRGNSAPSDPRLAGILRLLDLNEVYGRTVVTLDPTTSFCLDDRSSCRASPCHHGATGIFLPQATGCEEPLLSRMALSPARPSALARYRPPNSGGGSHIAQPAQSRPCLRLHTRRISDPVEHISQDLGKVRT